MIERPEYLEQLKRFKDKDLIKVVTGIRRLHYYEIKGCDLEWIRKYFIMLLQKDYVFRSRNYF